MRQTLRAHLAPSIIFADVGGKSIWKLGNKIKCIRICHGMESCIVGFLADKGASFFWEGDDGVSTVNYGVIDCKERHS